MQADLNGLVAATLREPRAFARWLIGQQLPASTGWLALALMAVGSALLSSLALRIAPITDDPVMLGMFGSPLKIVAIQAVVLIAATVLIHLVGRMFGGSGRFSDALVLISWIEATLLVVQAAQILLLLVLPPLAEGLGLIAIGLFFWLVSNFVAELHGFRSVGLVFLGILGTVFTVSIALAALAVAVLIPGV